MALLRLTSVLLHKQHQLPRFEPPTFQVLIQIEFEYKNTLLYTLTIFKTCMIFIRDS